jgi:hypothetical protein
MTMPKAPLDLNNGPILVKQYQDTQAGREHAVETESRAYEAPF